MNTRCDSTQLRMRHVPIQSYAGERAAQMKRENVEIVEFIQFIRCIYIYIYQRSYIIIRGTMVHGRMDEYRVLHFTRIELMIFHIGRFGMNYK